MKDFRGVIKVSLLAGMVLTIASCQQNGILHEINPDAKRNAYIEFGNYVNNMTRASKTSGTGFSVGDTMAVWGIQNTDGVVDVIFNNHDIRYMPDGTWTYDNKKLWNIGSTYMFYGMYPYSKTLYTMSNDENRYITIPEYTTANNPDSQIDLMISERRNVSPFKTVDMYFHHILSNVNINAKISDGLDISAIDSVVIKSIRLYNVRSTGHYAQTGWTDDDRAVGSWTDVKGFMDIPTKTEIQITQSTKAIFADYLMIPQMLFDTVSQPKDVCVDAIFKILYKDGTTSTFNKKGIRLAGITGNSSKTSQPISAWQPNYRYNYTLAFNPQIATRIWDADGDGSIQINPLTGDTITSLKIDPVTGDTIDEGDDTPYPGLMKYSPDEPDVVYVFEDTDNDGIPDKWVEYPVVWEDVDEDGLLEAGIDRDGDGHIDNLDGDDKTQQVPGGDPDKDPTDGNPKNPQGKDVILVHIDSDGDGDVDDDDEWVQIQKDPKTGKITPTREVEDATIEFTATVQDWDQVYTIDYDLNL